MTGNDNNNNTMTNNNNNGITDADLRDSLRIMAAKHAETNSADSGVASDPRIIAIEQERAAVALAERVSTPRPTNFTGGCAAVFDPNEGTRVDAPRRYLTKRNPTQLRGDHWCADGDALIASGPSDIYPMAMASAAAYRATGLTAKERSKRRGFGSRMGNNKRHGIRNPLPRFVGEEVGHDAFCDALLRRDAAERSHALIEDAEEALHNGTGIAGHHFALGMLAEGQALRHMAFALPVTAAERRAIAGNVISEQKHAASDARRCSVGDRKQQPRWMKQAEGPSLVDIADVEVATVDDALTLAEAGEELATVIATLSPVLQETAERMLAGAGHGELSASKYYRPGDVTARSWEKRIERVREAMRTAFRARRHAAT